MIHTFVYHVDILSYVNIQLHVGDLLSGVNDRAGREYGSHRDVGGNTSSTDSGDGTLGGTNGGVLLDGDLGVAVAGGDEENIGLVLNVDSDETLTVGDRDRRDRKTSVFVNVYTDLF